MHASMLLSALYKCEIFSAEPSHTAISHRYIRSSSLALTYFVYASNLVGKVRI